MGEHSAETKSQRPDLLQPVGAGKSKQVWLKRSLGTKDLREANVRGNA
jgi:hypothetical protein